MARHASGGLTRESKAGDRAQSVASDGSRKPPKNRWLLAACGAPSDRRGRWPQPPRKSSFRHLPVTDRLLSGPRAKTEYSGEGLLLAQVRERIGPAVRVGWPLAPGGEPAVAGEVRQVGGVHGE